MRNLWQNPMIIPNISYVLKPTMDKLFVGKIWLTREKLCSISNQKGLDTRLFSESRSRLKIYRILPTWALNNVNKNLFIFKVITFRRFFDWWGRSEWILSWFNQVFLFPIKKFDCCRIYLIIPKSKTQFISQPVAFHIFRISLYSYYLFIWFSQDLFTNIRIPNMHMFICMFTISK